MERRLLSLAFALGGVAYISDMMQEVYNDLYSLKGSELRTKYACLLKEARYLERFLTDIQTELHVDVAKENLKKLKEELGRANVYRMEDKDIKESSLNIINILESIMENAKMKMIELSSKQRSF